MINCILNILQFVGFVVFYIFGRNEGYKDALKDLTNGTIHLTINTRKITMTANQGNDEE